VVPAYELSFRTVLFTACALLMLFAGSACVLVGSRKTRGSRMPMVVLTGLFVIGLALMEFFIVIPLHRWPWEPQNRQLTSRR
jgi:hypothetical protein